MKKLFTFLTVGLLSIYGVQAQSDITPSRYIFSNQPVGAYSLDKQTQGANPVISDPDVKDKWNNGFITINNGQFVTSTTMSGKAAILNSAYQIFDMGGQVGKVLMMKGSGSTFEYGVAGDPGFDIGWWNKSFYTDKDLTPSVTKMLPDGVTGETATPEQIADATKKATVRMKVVFHIHQNAISTTNKFFDILGYTFTGNFKGMPNPENPTKQFKSGDFADIDFDEEEEIDIVTYNPNKWIACEYDFVAAETAGAPLRFTFRFGGGTANTTLMIKSITFTADPIGEAVESTDLTLVSDPTATSVGAQAKVADLDCYETVAGQKNTFYTYKTLLISCLIRYI